MEAVVAWAAANSGTIALVSAGMQAISAINQGNNQSAMYESQAQANAYNAEMARQNAQIAAEQGNANEEAQRRHARIALGAQRAAIAEAGIGTDGSAGDLYEQSASNAEMDALNIRYQANLQSAGFTNQAGLDDWQASQNRANASRATTAGFVNAGASALSGFGGYLQGQARIANAGKGASTT